MDQKEKPSLNIDLVIQKLLKESVDERKFCLDQTQVKQLCSTAQSVFASEPMLLQLKPPMVVCGDIHGHFSDLKRIFEMQGYPEEGTNYLFLGDYVDRGKHSLETICLLLAYKIKFKNNFFVLRGNHQCSEVNRIYGFYDQCKRRSSIKIWKIFSYCFQWLPLAAVLGFRIFCVHGGLSPKINNVSQINKIRRPATMDRESILCDMLWSDPSDFQGWNINQERGIGYTFGHNVVHSFLKKYDFDLICRSHQVVEDGYCFGKDKELLTIFSASHYCGKFNNSGALLIVDDNMHCSIMQLKIQQQEIKQKRRWTQTPKTPYQSIEVPERKHKTWQPSFKKLEKVENRKLTKLG